jgi:hypothetical protein
MATSSTSRLSPSRESTGGPFRHTHLGALEPLHAGWQVLAVPQFRASENRLRPEPAAIFQEDANRNRSVGGNPVVIELVRRAQNAQVFLRMAAIEPRRLAEEDPDIAAELRRVAQELEVDAKHLTPRDAE